MTERRLLFGSVAEQYDAFRPSYPPEMVDEVLRYAPGSPAELRVLDVGAGTGIVTRQFAPLVSHVTAVEPDAGMAAAARAHPQAPENVTHVSGDFEHAALPAGGFELLVSGTAWHWVSPQVRYRRAAEVLAPRGGALAAFWNGPEWHRSPLRSELEHAYREVEALLPEHSYSVMHPANSANRLQLDFDDNWEQQIADAPQLRDPQTRIYRWSARYSAAQYTGMLGTHSDHLLLDPENRARLMDKITAVIDGPGGGSLELPYRTLLCLARTG